ncbi:hypothetical protein [Enterobacter roggenkampii]
MLKALYGTRVRELNIAIAQGNTVNFCTLDGASVINGNTYFSIKT